jgi:hypothetical protein
LWNSEPEEFPLPRKPPALDDPAPDRGGRDAEKTKETSEGRSAVPEDRKSSVTRMSDANSYFFLSLRINVRAAHVFRLVWSSRSGAEARRCPRAGAFGARASLGSACLAGRLRRQPNLLASPGLECIGTVGALFESVDARRITGTSWNGPRLFGPRSGEESTVLVAPVFLAKGNFTKIGPLSETLPARTQLPDPLPDSSSWPEGPP